MPDVVSVEKVALSPDQLEQFAQIAHQQHWVNHYQYSCAQLENCGSLASAQAEASRRDNAEELRNKLLVNADPEVMAAYATWRDWHLAVREQQFARLNELNGIIFEYDNALKVYPEDRSTAQQELLSKYDLLALQTERDELRRTVAHAFVD